jgi:hypothetical protein
MNDRLVKNPFTIKFKHALPHARLNDSMRRSDPFRSLVHHASIDQPNP